MNNILSFFGKTFNRARKGSMAERLISRPVGAACMRAFLCGTHVCVPYGS